MSILDPIERMSLVRSSVIGPFKEEAKGEAFKLIKPVYRWIRLDWTNASARVSRLLLPTSMLIDLVSQMRSSVPIAIQKRVPLLAIVLAASGQL
jgi:hypothetical protein